MTINFFPVKIRAHMHVHKSKTRACTFYRGKTCTHTFLTRACPCVHGSLWKKNMVVNYYLINLSLKFHKDPSFGWVDIGKIKLTFCNQYFSMYFYNIYQNATFLGCSLIFFKGSPCQRGHIFIKCHALERTFPPKLASKCIFGKI